MRLFAAILAVVFLTAHVHAAARPGAKSPPEQTAKEKAKAAEQAATFDDREALAKLQAMDIFPDMEIEDSAFADAVSVEVECLECETPAFFKSPAWPLHVARKVAARTGVKPLSVAEIRRRVAEKFEVDADAFQQVHGIQFVSARLTLGEEVLDVLPQLAASVNARGFTVDCDGSLLAALADVSQYERNEGESSADYWKRQRKLLAAVADARVGQESLEIKFEFHSETVTAAAKSGERLVISEEGKVSVSKIAPTAHVVRATDPIGAPQKSAPKPVKSAAGRSAKK